MKRFWTLMLLLPTIALGNEAAHSTEAKATAKPAGNSTAHAPIKNAPPTQVDNLKPMSKAKAESSGAEAEPAAATAHSAKPTEPPVVQYVPPKYTSATPLVRQYVPSKAPSARSAHSRAPKAKSSHSTKAAASENMAVTPGIVRVLPSSSLPSGKVLPAAKLASDAGASDNSASKPRLTWGESTVIKPAVPAPEIYIVKDPELRWQQYSYP